MKNSSYSLKIAVIHVIWNYIICITLLYFITEFRYDWIAIIKKNYNRKIGGSYYIYNKNIYHDYRLKQGGQTIQLPRGVAITARMRNHG